MNGRHTESFSQLERLRDEGVDTLHSPCPDFDIPVTLLNRFYRPDYPETRPSAREAFLTRTLDNRPDT